MEDMLENSAWPAAVMERVNAEARMISAKAALWHLAGASLLAIGIGAGAGLGCLGYSYITDNQASATKIADAISKAFAGLTINAEGTLKLADGGQVELKPGGEVSVRPGGTVRIDPNSTVRLDGRISADTPRPSAKQMGSEIRSVPNAVTDYVVFKTVTFAKGRVETGWHYVSSEQANPDRQFCHYIEDLNATSEALVELGVDGRWVEPEAPPAGIDIKAARLNCVWK
jgi:hypothetical protein